MITKEYLQQELAKRIDGYKRGVATTTDNIIAEMKSILVLVDALQDRVKDYDDALKRAKDFKNGTVQFALEPGESIVHYIFPELRESEDEEIRQQLLWLCGQWEHNPEGRTIPADISNIRKIRNWLEKQKEQKHYWKPTETDTALFNKAVTTNKALTPTERAQLDIVRSKFGYCGAVNCSGIVQKEKNPTQSNIEKEYIRTIKSLIADFLRGKCDIDAGYYQKIYDWLDGRHIESKPIEWNEEDENIRKQLISICDEWLNGGYNARPCLDDVRWLKNLLENQKEPTTVEWNEEDKDYYDTIVRKLEVIGDDSGLSSNQIKFLREHCPLHRSEWSEEDETIIEGACSALEIHGHTKLASKLKSLHHQPKQEWSEEDEKKDSFP